MLEYFCFPACSRSRRSSRSTPSVSAAEYRYSPWPASSCTLASRIALRRRLGALVIQFPSGCMPMISEWACWAICRISVLRYPSGIQSRGSIRWSSAISWSNRSCIPSGARPSEDSILSTLPYTRTPSAGSIDRLLPNERSVNYVVHNGRMSTVSGQESVTEEPPAIPSRAARGRPARYTREGLLDLVVGVFNERGYEGASMEDLAKASGFTKSTFYHHVSGKEELLRMAVSRALDALSAALDQTVEGGGSPVEQLQDAVRRTTEVLLAELPYVTLLLRVRGNTEIEREALARRRVFDARLATLVAAAVDAGEIRDDIDPKLVSRLLFGMVNSITEWYRPGSRANSKKSVVDAVVNLALDGLKDRRSQI